MRRPEQVQQSLLILAARADAYDLDPNYLPTTKILVPVERVLRGTNYCLDLFYDSEVGSKNTDHWLTMVTEGSELLRIFNTYNNKGRNILVNGISCGLSVLAVSFEVQKIIKQHQQSA